MQIGMTHESARQFLSPVGGTKLLVSTEHRETNDAKHAGLLLKGEITCFSPGRPGVNIVNDQVTFLLFERQTSPILCYRGRPYAECLYQTIPSLDL